ncbi:YihY/virulence factor BrkB family protein [Peptoniphilus sp. GNH]|nr:YihY family protein [Clostridiales bacterium KA00134]UHR03498.1 YihY/virulence factor BrkB family protein [Peptoniphilus sp. GNH]
MKLKNFYKRNKDKTIFYFFDDLISRIVNHRISLLASSQVYYIVLSIFPFLIALVNILALADLKTKILIPNLPTALPDDIKKILLNFVSGVEASSSPLLLIASSALGLWSASRGFMSIMQNINTSYKLPHKRQFFISKILSFFMALVCLTLFTLALFFMVFGGSILNLLENILKVDISFDYLILRINSYLIPLIFIGVMVYIIYYASPNIRDKKTFPKRLFLPGTLFAILGFFITSRAFSYYVESISKFSVTYGSLGGIVVFLVWLYLMNFIILTGGEINAHFYCKFIGSDNESSIFEDLIK